MLTFNQTLTLLSVCGPAAGKPWLTSGRVYLAKLPTAGMEGPPTPAFNKTFVHHFCAGLMISEEKGEFLWLPVV